MAPELLSSIKTAPDHDFCPTAVEQLTSNLDGVLLLKDPHYCTAINTTNLLSLSLLSEKFGVLLDTKIDDAFYVFDSEDNYLRFGKCKSSKLYTLYLKKCDHEQRPEQ